MREEPEFSVLQSSLQNRDEHSNHLAVFAETEWKMLSVPGSIASSPLRFLRQNKDSFTNTEGIDQVCEGKCPLPAFAQDLQRKVPTGKEEPGCSHKEQPTNHLEFRKPEVLKQPNRKSMRSLREYSVAAGHPGRRTLPGPLPCPASRCRAQSWAWSLWREGGCPGWRCTDAVGMRKGMSKMTVN